MHQNEEIRKLLIWKVIFYSYSTIFYFRSFVKAICILITISLQILIWNFSSFLLLRELRQMDVKAPQFPAAREFVQKRIDPYIKSSISLANFDQNIIPPRVNHYWKYLYHPYNRLDEIWKIQIGQWCEKGVHIRTSSWKRHGSILSLARQA